jgi:ADP-ribose pyrophosphatase YjhB (NUDIX family)
VSRDGWRFCPRCAAALAVAPGGGVVGDDRPRLHCPACGLVIYDNPAPTASVLVFRPDGAVLLAKRAIDPERGRWDVPGGFVERDEHPEDAARRELREETGLDVRLTGLVGFFLDSYAGTATLNIVYRGEVVGGATTLSEELEELRWFAPDELPPPGGIAFRNGAEALAAALAQSA